MGRVICFMAVCVFTAHAAINDGDHDYVVTPVDIQSSAPRCFDSLARLVGDHLQGRAITPNGIINPPAWDVTNSFTNTIPDFVVEPGGSVVSYTATVFLVLYSYTNDPGSEMAWFDFRAYPHGLTVTDRRGRTLVNNEMPEGAGPCFWVSDYDGKFLLLLKQTDDTYSILLYRVTRRGLTLLGERAGDVLFGLLALEGGTGPSLQGGKVVTAPMVIDLPTFTYTSAIECYDRRLSKLIWSRPSAPGQLVEVNAGGRDMFAFRNGVACVVDWTDSPFSWTVSKKSKALYTHSTPVPTDADFWIRLDARGGAVYWTDTGTSWSPTNSQPTYVDRKGTRPLVFPGLGNVNWDCEAYDGKYFITRTLSTPHTLRAYSLKGTPRLQGERTVADYRTIRLDGSRGYVLTRAGAMEGAYVYSANLKQEKWNVPASECSFDYLGRGVLLRQVLNTNVSPMQVTLTFLTRRGTLAEHTFSFDWPAPITRMAKEVQR